MHMQNRASQNWVIKTPSVCLKNNFSKMNSLYQIRSKMLHGTKVIILVEKKIEKEVTWLGFELTTFILEVESAYHFTMDPSY